MKEPIAKPSMESLQAFEFEKARMVPMINIVRLGLLAVFLTLAFAFGGAGGQESWQQRMVPGGVYLATGLLLFFLQRMDSSVAGLVQNSIWLFDVPLVFIVQVSAMSVTDNPGAIASFTAGVYLILIMASTLTLDEKQIWLVTFTSVAAAVSMQALAGDTGGGMTSCTALLLGGGLLCNFAKDRRMELVETVVEERIQRDELARYLSPEIVTEILSAGHDIEDGKKYEVTVLFNDVRDFTELTASMKPEEIVELLNDYHTRMVNTVFQFGGTLDKYLGDGLMAYFGAPMPHKDHPMRAVRCAREMAVQLEQMNLERDRLDKRRLKMGVGIHTGEAVMGSIGAPQRMDFTIVGEAVNFASRMEGLTKENDVAILISEQTRQRIGESTFFTQLPPVKVRGKTESVTTFMVKT